MSSPSIEDYIKSIYKAHLAADHVSSQDVALRVGVTATAVSKMLKRLKDLRLVEHAPYQDIRLTQTGEKMALEIIRHHRLLELYLVEALGYEWDRVHVEAERLEHHISEEFEDKIDAFLGYPAACPHGDPIPTRDGVMPSVSRRTLAQQAPPAHLTIRAVSDADAALLRYLKELGLLPGTAIELIEQQPFNGPYVVKVGGNIVHVAPGAAEQIFIKGEHDK